VTEPAPPGAATPVPAAARPVRLFSLCLIAAVVASYQPLPWRFGASVFLVVAIVYGTRSLLALVGSARPAQVALVSCLLALSVVLLLAQVAQLIAYPLFSEYQQCVDGAITERGRDACEDRLTDLDGSGLLPARG
jgi:hypothetical protein